MKIEEIYQITKENLKGKIICFPTDTVYGLGCMLEDEDALNKIYKLKHRNPSKPLAILVGNNQDINPYVKEVPTLAKKLINDFWPGALTIIFNKKEGILDGVVRGKNTIGFRMPNSIIALKILQHFGPMATTSVNISNEEPLNDLNEIKNLFGDLIDIYITDKEVVSKVSSTVIDITSDPYKILRQGDIIIK